MRVYELAKELNVSSKDMLEKIHGFGVEAANHMCALTAEQMVVVRAKLAEEGISLSGSPAAEAGESSTEEEPLSVPETVTPEAVPEEAAPKVIVADGPIIVKDFASALGLKPNQLIAELMKLNVFASINAKLAPQTDAIEDEPFDSVISDTTRMTYGKRSLSGSIASTPRRARRP